MYDIEYTLETLEDLKRFRKYEQPLIIQTTRWMNIAFLS